MIINVGTNNRSKIKAVNLAFSHYYKDFKINSVKVNSDVDSQPKSLKEITKGAKTRAINAFNSGKCDLAIGIESGIFEFPETHSGYMDTSCTVIFDGKDFFIGSSPCFEYPKKVIDKIFKEKKEVTVAFHELGWSEKNLGSEQGAVGLLTKGIIPREKYTEFSIIMALMRMLNKELYK